MPVDHNKQAPLWQTQVRCIEPGSLATAAAQEWIAEAAAHLQAGHLVGFPTETVYGLGANALDAAAVAGIFAAKGRPADNPLIVHIADLAQLPEIASQTPLGERLAAHFWPGPLTLVLPKKPVIPDVVSAGLATVGVRFPVHPLAQALIRAAQLPVAAPSANTSGRPSPTQAAHVYEDLAGKIPIILDGGPVDIGLESTVVSAVGEVPVLLRPGKITAEQLAAVAGDIAYPDAASARRPSAPGMKYPHYAPRGEVVLAADAAALAALYRDVAAAGEPLIILFDDSAPQLRAAGAQDLFVIAKRGDLESYARNLFAAFRLADARDKQLVLVEKPPETGLGVAINNRLSKAATGGRFATRA